MPDKQAVGTYAERFGDEFQGHILATAARVPGYLLRYRSAFEHTYFTADLHRRIAKALFAHVDEFHSLPSRATLVEDVRPTVSDDEMPQIEKSINALYKDDLQDAKAVQAKTIEFGKQQAMCNAVLEGADLLDGGQRDKILPLIQKALLTGEDLTDVGIEFADIAARASWYLNPSDELDTIPTGIPHLDYALGGGLGRGELGVVLAPPKRGKSTTLVNIGYGAVMAAAGFNVAYYSCEMSDKKVTKRFDARLGGKYIKTRTAAPEKWVEHLQRLKKFVKGRLFVKSYPTRSLTATMIRSHLSLLTSRDFHPDLIIVDYADIMRAERRFEGMRHEQAGIYEDLRHIAGDYDAACWTGSQAKAGALEKETLTMADFAEAFEKAAIMDAGMAFCQTDDEKIDRIFRLVLVGLRNQEDGRIVECRINRKRCLIDSYALRDAGNEREWISVEEQDEDSNKGEQVTKASTVETGDALKKRAGLKKPKRKKGPYKKKFKSKKGPYKKRDIPKQRFGGE